ncbi:MAG: ribbon-helix-helix protein, CopG family [Burkholderiales bacterium]|nr:ribbon-helix-helix protein, CopG family [Burkholderiales bacterium]
MSTMQLTNVHLRPAQKEALQQRAKANGSNVAEEIRNAVDAYLAGVTSDELALLDAATKRTEALLAEMNEMLDGVNRKAERIFAEMAKLRGGDPENLPQ